MEWGNWAIDKFNQILRVPLVWKRLKKEGNVHNKDVLQGGMEGI